MKEKGKRKENREKRKSLFGYGDCDGREGWAR